MALVANGMGYSGGSAGSLPLQISPMTRHGNQKFAKGMKNDPTAMADEYRNGPARSSSRFLRA